MEEEMILKCEIQLNRLFFPKGKSFIKSGEYAIFSANIIKNIENCEDIFTIKLKGNVCKLEYGTVYKVTCKLSETNEQYGDTYEILYINKLIDLKDIDKQKCFLKGIIREELVDKLFKQYDNVIKLLENKDIESLLKVKGIGNSTALRIIEEYEDAKDYSSIYTELGQVGFSSTMITKLIDHYTSPDAIVDIVKSDPYDLVKINGVGFKTADTIALKTGIGINDYRRLRGFIIHTLMEQGEAGKSYLTFSELMDSIYDILGYVEQETINKTADMLIKNKEVVILDNGNAIALKKYYDLEINILKELLRLKNSESDFIYEDDFEQIIKDVEQEQGFDFTSEQINTIKMSMNNNIVAITGGGGSGKSSTAKGICAIHSNYIIIGVALSGKAAVRITEATGLAASTIHKALGWTREGFTFNEYNPLSCDLLLIDEATMINGDLFLSLLKALKNGTKVVMMGDVQQLTPIGNCQVYADILDSKVIAMSKLTKLHRQALRSGIIPTSISIAAQEQIFNSNFKGTNILGELQDMELDIEKDKIPLSDKVIQHFLKHLELTNDLMETQVVVAMRVRGDLSCWNLNTKIQSIINPIQKDDDYLEVQIKSKKDDPKTYNIKVGDKVLNTKNNYKSLNVEGIETTVYNGNIGIVKEINNGTCLIDFEGIGEIVFGRKEIKGLELAYVCTISKMQGSGFNTTIVAIDDSSYVLNNAESLYTALTRAKKYCVLVAKNSAIRSCISKREVKTKQTLLKRLLECSNK